MFRITVHIRSGLEQHIGAGLLSASASKERRLKTPTPREENMGKRQRGTTAPEDVAGNGLLHRRALLGGGIVFAGALGTGASLTGASAAPLAEPEWSLEPGE